MNQERAALGIVFWTALRWVALKCQQPLSSLLLKQGRVKWAFWVRLHYKKWVNRSFYIWLLVLLCLSCSGCTSLPTPQHKNYRFPDQRAYLGGVQRPYRSLGYVRSKVNFQTLDSSKEEDELCQNYFNRSVQELVHFAKKKGGDAVIHVGSIVFFLDGQHKIYPRPECSDDGIEGQVLTQGEVIQWNDR